MQLHNASLDAGQVERLRALHWRLEHIDVPLRDGETPPPAGDAAPPTMASAEHVIGACVALV